VQSPVCPTAEASSAAIAADLLIASISQLADSANGIGLIYIHELRQTKIKGIPNLVSSTVFFCVLTSLTPLTFSIEPTKPFF
jgi:hypothetical protein